MTHSSECVQRVTHSVEHVRRSVECVSDKFYRVCVCDPFLTCSKDNVMFLSWKFCLFSIRFHCGSRSLDEETNQWSGSVMSLCVTAGRVLRIMMSSMMSSCVSGLPRGAAAGWCSVGTFDIRSGLWAVISLQSAAVRCPGPSIRPQHQTCIPQVTHLNTTVNTPEHQR